MTLNLLLVPGDAAPPPSGAPSYGLLLLLSSAGEAPPPPPPDPTPSGEPDGASYAQIFGGTYAVPTGLSASDVAVQASASSGGPRITFDLDSDLGGAARITTQLYRATADNVWLEDISDRVEAGSITVDISRTTPMTLEATTTQPDVVTAATDWIAPVTTYSYPDATTGRTVTVRHQLGLYLVMPSTKTYTAAQGIERIDAYDPLWLLAASGPGEPWSRASGQNVGIAIETVCNLAGVRHAIQTTSQTLPKRRTWPWNATWLEIANDLARSIGFVPLWPDRTGRVRSHRFRKLGSVQPARLISHTNGMVIDTVTLDPDMTRFCNHVVVVGNDPKGNPVVAERLNNDRNSPTSTTTLGFRKSRFEEDPNIDDQDAADQLADRLIEQGSSVYQRMTVRTLPVLDWEIGEVTQVDIATDAGDPVASGRWRWDRLTMGLGVDATCEWRLSKLVSFGTVT